MARRCSRRPALRPLLLLPRPTAAQFLLLDLGEERYALLLPLIDKQTYRATLRPPR